MKKLLLLPLVLVFVAPIGMVLLIASMASGSDDCGPGGSTQQTAGQTLDAEQLGNAQTIVSTVRSLLPSTPYAAVVALATAYQESKLRNLSKAVDHTSIGLFQQQPRFYTLQVASDPVKATTAFINRLIKVPHWQTLPLAQAAQSVQRSAHSNAYSRWQPLAEQLTDQLWPGPNASCSDNPGPDGSSGSGNLPEGFQEPSNERRKEVVNFALAQLGKPYVYGAEGPDAYDCSGLVQAAWAAAGIAIPRTTFDQVKAGVPVPSTSDMEPGDLIFIPGEGDGGTPSHPGHVGMYIGAVNGVQYLVQAPHTGTTVTISTVKSWANQIVAIRRP